MHEIETKVLEVNRDEIVEKLRALGAEETQDTRLTVDWYSIPGTKSDSHPWYLRVRKTAHGMTEISWKSLPTIIGNTRQSQEVNVDISDFENGKKLLEAIGLSNYAHQEKDRHSFKFKDWSFDIDTYPGMPTYLEIEGTSVDHVAEAITLLGLENHQSISEGERRLIEEKYGLNWSDMRF